MTSQRRTAQKQAVYDALRALDHPSATEVYAYLQGKEPAVSRGTVFRVLSAFSESGRVKKLRLLGPAKLAVQVEPGQPGISLALAHTPVPPFEGFDAAGGGMFPSRSRKSQSFFLARKMRDLTVPSSMPRA